MRRPAEKRHSRVLLHLSTLNFGGMGGAHNIRHSKSFCLLFFSQTPGSILKSIRVAETFSSVAERVEKETTQPNRRRKHVPEPHTPNRRRKQRNEPRTPTPNRRGKPQKERQNFSSCGFEQNLFWARQNVRNAQLFLKDVGRHHSFS